MQAQLLGRLARLEIRLGECAAADAHALEAAKLHAADGDAAGQVAALTTAVLACTQMRRYDDAYAAAFAAHDVTPTGAGPELNLMATRALGAAHASAGSYEEALQLFARMIDLSQESNLAAWERTARTDWLVINLGWLTDPAALHAPAPDRAHLTMLQSWAENLLQQPSDGSPELQLRERATHYAVLAQIHVALGNAAAARDAVDAVMRDAVQLTWSHGLAEGSVVEADVCLLEGNAERGVELARRGVELAQKFDLIGVESKAHDVLSRCAEAAGDHATAVRALRRHMQVTREILRLRSENRVRIERWRESQKQREQLDTLTAEASFVPRTFAAGSADGAREPPRDRAGRPGRAGGTSDRRTPLRAGAARHRSVQDHQRPSFARRRRLCAAKAWRHAAGRTARRGLRRSHRR